MKHPTPVIFRMRKACCFTALLLGVGPFLNAQSTPASVDEGTETTKEVVVLNPFLVTQEDEGGYGISQSALGTRTVQPILNLPSSVAAINREFLDDLNAATMADALNFGVSGVTNSTINSDDVNIRGFRANQALRDGVMVVNFKRNPMYDVDRIEVIKGPSGLLLGNTLFHGGVVNYATLLPTTRRTGFASTTVGSYDSTVRVTANSSGPLVASDDFTALYRVTIGGEWGDPEKVDQAVDQLFIGSALTFKFQEGRLRLDTVYYHFNDDGYSYYDDFLDIQRSVTGGRAYLNRYSTESFAAAQKGQAFWHQRQDYFNATFTGQLTDNGNFRVYYAHHRVVDRRAHLRAIGVQADNKTLSRQDLPFAVDNNSDILQAEYLYKTIRGNWRNDLQVGMDAYFETFWQRYALLTPPAIDASNPDYTYTRPAFTGYNASNGRAEKRNGTYWFQDNLTLFNERLILIGGLRWVDSHVVNENLVAKTTGIDDPPLVRTHRYGAVFKPTPKVSLYYADAANVTAIGGIDGYGRPLRNQEGKLKEYGVKYDLTYGNLALTGSLAHFDMANTNVQIYFTDPVLGLIIIQDPTGDTAKGWEAEVRAQWKTDAGTADLIATYYDAETLRVSTRGPATEAPGRVHSLFGKYTWTDGPLAGLTVGGGVFDQSEKITGAYTTDFPATYSLLARYAINPQWSVQLNGDNVTDERYVVFIANPALVQVAAGANYRLSVKYTW